MDKSYGDGLRLRVRSAVDDAVKATLALAALLYEVDKGTIQDAKGTDVPLVESWGFEDLHHYSESELGIHGGRAHMYVAVHELLVLKHGAAALPSSIAKLSELVKVARMEPKDVKPWIAKAAKMTACEFQHAIGAAYGFGGGRVAVSFRFDVKDGERIKKWARLAQEKLGADTAGDALLQVVREWTEANKSRVAPVAKKAG